MFDDFLALLHFFFLAGAEAHAMEQCRATKGWSKRSRSDQSIADDRWWQTNDGLSRDQHRQDRQAAVLHDPVPVDE